MEAQRFLITGGCGFIGSHLAAALLAKGASVVVLDNLSFGTAANLPASAELIVGDILNIEDVERAFTGVDGCFHLAALPQTIVQDRALQRSVNRLGAANVMRAARRTDTKFIFASSAALYGEAPHEPVGENSPLRPLSGYGADKLVGERLMRRMARQGLHCCGLRMFNVYGARARTGLGANLLRASDGVIEIYGDGGQTRDFVFVEDAVSMIVAAMDAASTEAPVFNVCSGRQTSVLEFLAAFNRHARAPISPRFVAPLALEIRHSCGDTQRMSALSQTPSVDLDTGLRAMLERAYSEAA